MFPVVAVDFGGTNIRAALFPTDDPHPSIQHRIPTRAVEGPEAVIGRLIASVDKVAPRQREGLRIAVASPGPLDPRQGIVFGAPNLPGWDCVPLRDRLGSHFACPVALGNDANLAALGEWKYGAGVGHDNVLYLTISTGIGGGVIADGSLLLGSRGLAAELGHMIVAPGGPPCGCGKRGHLEAVAAGPAIARRARERIEAGEGSSLSTTTRGLETITALDVGKAAVEGDALARVVLAEAGELIGWHVASLIHAFNPEIIILGGGVAQVGELLFSPILDAVRQSVMHDAYLEGLSIVPAMLGDDAGLIGAMVLARGLHDTSRPSTSSAAAHGAVDTQPGSLHRESGTEE